jgi:hypothetical protein
MFFPSAQKAASIGFVHSKTDNSRIKGKAALRSIHKKLHKFVHIQLQLFAEWYTFLYKEPPKVFLQQQEKLSKSLAFGAPEQASVH